MSKLAIYYIYQPSSISINIFRWSSTSYLIKFCAAYGFIYYTFANNIFLESRNSDKIFVRINPQKKAAKKFLGLFFTLVLLSIQDVSLGYKFFLEMRGVGFKIYREQRQLLLEVGFSHIVTVPIPATIFVRILNKKHTKFLIRGFHRHIICEFANFLKLCRIPNEYTLKGIHYKNSWLKKKPGKELQQK